MVSNVHLVCCKPLLSNPRFRLTRKANSDDVKNLLLDGCGPLAELHTRVMEAGCEVDPDWKLGMEKVKRLSSKICKEVTSAALEFELQWV